MLAVRLVFLATLLGCSGIAIGSFQPMRIPQGVYKLDPSHAVRSGDRFAVRISAHCADISAATPVADDVFRAASGLTVQIVPAVGEPVVRSFADAVRDGLVEIAGDGVSSVEIRFRNPGKGATLSLIAEDLAVLAPSESIKTSTLARVNASRSAREFRKRADQINAALRELPQESPLAKGWADAVQDLEWDSLETDADPTKLLSRLSELAERFSSDFSPDVVSLQIGRSLTPTDRAVIKKAFGKEVAGSVSPAVSESLEIWAAVVESVQNRIGPPFSDYVRRAPTRSIRRRLELAKAEELVAGFQRDVAESLDPRGDPVGTIFAVSFLNGRRFDHEELGLIKRALGGHVAADYPPGSEVVFEGIASTRESLGAALLNDLYMESIRRSSGEWAAFRRELKAVASREFESYAGTSSSDLDVIELLGRSAIEGGKLKRLDGLAKLAGKRLERSGAFPNTAVVRQRSMDEGRFTIRQIGRQDRDLLAVDGSLVSALRDLAPDAEIVGEPSRELISAMRDAGRIVLRTLRDFRNAPVRNLKPVRIIFVASTDVAIARQLYPGQAVGAVTDAAKHFVEVVPGGELADSAGSLRRALAKARADGRDPVVMFDNRGDEGIIFGAGDTMETVTFEEMGEIVPLACNFIRPDEFGFVTTDYLFLKAMAGAWGDVRKKIDLDAPGSLNTLLLQFQAGYERHAALDAAEANAKVRVVLVQGAGGLGAAGLIIAVAADWQKPSTMPAGGEVDDGAANRSATRSSATRAVGVQ